MDAEQFIARIVRHVAQPTVESVLKNIADPPERVPSDGSLLKARWYARLENGDRGLLRATVQESVFAALFDFLCVLDHVAFIESSPARGQFELYYVKEGQRVLLNDFGRCCLHDGFKAIWDETVGGKL